MRQDYRSPDDIRIDGKSARQNARGKSHRFGARALILELTTSFIWLTPIDVLSIVEQINDDISEISVRVALFHLVREGKLEKRLYRGERFNGYQVKKPCRV